jgi:hypothetical protein
MSHRICDDERDEQEHVDDAHADAGAGTTPLGCRDDRTLRQVVYRRPALAAARQPGPCALFALIRAERRGHVVLQRFVSLK